MKHVHVKLKGAESTVAVHVPIFSRDVDRDKSFAMHPYGESDLDANMFATFEEQF